MSVSTRSGFTVVELLVVVTIIVVLLALLAPAIDQAVYQAELAVCETQLKNIATGVVHYAMENKRWYPYRSGVHDLSFYWSPFSLSQGANNTTHDDRPELRPYVNINGAFNDPMCVKVDFDNSPPEAWLWTPRNMWFGFQYKLQPTNPTLAVRQDRGMLRVGDVLEWSDSGMISPPEQYRVLVSDMYWTRNDVADFVAAHPDDRGMMSTWALQSGNMGAEAKALNADTDGKVTVTRWNLMKVNPEQTPPGAWDFNYAFDDGGVGRITRVTWDGWKTDDRIGRVGLTRNGGAFVNDWNYIARR